MAGAQYIDYFDKHHYVLLSKYSTLIVQNIGGVGDGVELDFVQTVVNYGSIQGTDSVVFALDTGVYPGVEVNAGGQVINGGEQDTSAIISGYSGVRLANDPGEVTNFGTIASLFSNVYKPSGAVASGVELFAGGSVVNGTAVDRTALIEGYSGVAFASPPRPTPTAPCRWTAAPPRR